MNNEAIVFFAGAIPSLLIGFALGTLHEKGKTVTADTFIDKSLNWLSEGSRLIGLVVLALVFAVIAGLYTFDASQSNKKRDDSNLDCLNAYVTQLGVTQAPRTLAAKAMNDARRDWDRGFSNAKGATTLTKPELKVRYLEKYATYDRVSKNNPPVPPIRQFCEEHR